METPRVTFDIPLVTGSGIAKVTQGPRTQRKDRLVDSLFMFMISYIERLRFKISLNLVHQRVTKHTNNNLLVAYNPSWGGGY